MLPPLLVLNWPRQEVSQGDDSDGDDDDGDGDDGDCVDEWYFSFLPSDSPRHSAHAMQSQLLQHEMDIGFYPQCKQLVTIKL